MLVAVTYQSFDSEILLESEGIEVTRIHVDLHSSMGDSIEHRSHPLGSMIELELT